VEYEQLTHAIIGAAMEVHRALGPGFLESIYRNALIHELHLRNLSTKAELEVQVDYKDLIVGRHRLDIVVEDRVIIELKAASGIIDIHIAQVLSYLKATRLEVGLILNFGEESLVWKRLIKKPRITRI
jgi:GxxExxY protein